MNSRSIEPSPDIYARAAGFTFLFYIAAGLASMAMVAEPEAEGTAAMLASLAQQAGAVRLNLVLGLLMNFSALVLGVTLYQLTRRQGPGLALMAMACRFGEGFLGAAFITWTLGLLSLAASAEAGAPDSAAANLIGSFVLEARSWNPAISALFFAVGSTLFSYLLLRGRTIPIPLAWLGIAASLLLVAGLPAQIAGLLDGPAAMLMWLSMAAFEAALALLWLIKGLPEPRPDTAPMGVG